MTAAPPWITRTPEPLRSWYLVAWQDGIGALELARIAAADPLDGIAPRGTPLNLLSVDAQRMAVANGYAVAIARADGDAARYLRDVQALQKLERFLKWCPVTAACRPGRRPAGVTLGIWTEDIRRALRRLAKPTLGGYSPQSRHVFQFLLAAAALAVLGFLWRFSRG